MAPRALPLDASKAQIEQRWLESLAMAQSGDHQSALATTKDLLTHNLSGINLDASRLWFNLGQLMHAQSQPRQAASCLNECMSIDPDLAVGWYMFGWILFNLKKYSQAKAAFDFALQLLQGGDLTSVNYGPLGLDFALHLTQVRFNSEIVGQYLERQKVSAGLLPPPSPRTQTAPRHDYKDLNAMPCVLFRPAAVAGMGLTTLQPEAIDPTVTLRQASADTARSSNERKFVVRQLLKDKGFNINVFKKKKDEGGLVTTASTLGDFLNPKNSSESSTGASRPVQTSSASQNPSASSGQRGPSNPSIISLQSSDNPPSPQPPTLSSPHLTRTRTRTVTQDDPTVSRLEGHIPVRTANSVHWEDPQFLNFMASMAKTDAAKKQAEIQTATPQTMSSGMDEAAYSSGHSGSSHVFSVVQQQMAVPSKSQFYGSAATAAPMHNSQPGPQSQVQGPAQRAPPQQQPHGYQPNTQALPTPHHQQQPFRGPNPQPSFQHQPQSGQQQRQHQQQASRPALQRYPQRTATTPNPTFSIPGSAERYEVSRQYSQRQPQQGGAHGNFRSAYPGSASANPSTSASSSHLPPQQQQQQEQQTPTIRLINSPPQLQPQQSQNQRQRFLPSNLNPQHSAPATGSKPPNTNPPRPLPNQLHQQQQQQPQHNIFGPRPGPPPSVPAPGPGWRYEPISRATGMGSRENDGTGGANASGRGDGGHGSGRGRGQ